MMKPAIRGEVLITDGPEMYRLFVECRNCTHEIVLKKVWGPKPDRPLLTSLGAQLTCPSCNFEAVYPPADIRLGDVDPAAAVADCHLYPASGYACAAT
jgi:hypothetical protein